MGVDGGNGCGSRRGQRGGCGAGCHSTRGCHGKYIDLTHAIAPGGPLGEGFADFRVAAARAGSVVLMHGHEPLDTDNTAPQFVGEKWLLQHNFAQAEGVANIDQVPESGALIAIGFAKFEGGTGGLARYIAIAPSDWPLGDAIRQQPGAPLPTHDHALRCAAARTACCDRPVTTST